MTFWEAVLFGFIQGVTEIFPVSSSAHLSILGNLFGVSNGSFNFRMMTVFMHFGSLFAILFVFWNEFSEIINDLFIMISAAGGQAKGKRHYPHVRLLLMLIFSCLPLLLLIPFIDYIEMLYSGSIFIGVMLILTGLILFVGDRMNLGIKDERNMSLTDALLIGIAQLAAAIPGISRIACSMTACKACGLSKEFSLKYAYLLSVFVIFGMNIIHLVTAAQYGFSWAELPLCLVGMAVSGLVGVFAMRIVRNAAENGRFHNFAY